VSRHLVTHSLTPPALVVALALAGCGGGGGGGATSGTTGTHSSGTVAVRSSDLGKILVDGSGRTVYLFEKDKGSRSACSGACAASWPPVTVSGTPKPGPGISAKLLGTTRRSDGTMEVTYAGHPLYRYSGDAKAGDTNGEGSTAFGAAWYTLDGAGKKVEGGGMSSSGGGGYGY
jgi:predicted lipoprotein with Yx(FWY)xxD motif